MKSININEKISSHRVILIDAEGINKGEFLKTAAIELAKKDGLDLVEVGKNGPLPVCKIIDHGKVLYEKAKLDKHQKHAPITKEVRFKYNTDSHDIDLKKKKIEEFLGKGHKVVVAMLVKKGRERTVHKDTAKQKFLLLVSSFTSTVTLNDIKEGDKGYNYMLHPKAK